MSNIPFRAMIKRTACVVALTIPGNVTPLQAQSTEEHNVNTIDSTELGPYRPEHRADLERVRLLIRQQTNAFRKQEDLETTDQNEHLQQAAQKFAEYMARTNRYGHTADGKRPSQRAKEEGYDFCIVLENIAFEFRTTGFPTQDLAEGFVKGWKNSPPHRENMLDPDVTETGVGVSQSEKTGACYAVQMFGRPESAAIEFSLVNRSGEPVTYRVGENQFTLPSRLIRTHRVCRPPTVALQTEEGKNEKTVRPAQGQRFTITENEDGTLSIAQQPADTEPP